VDKIKKLLLDNEIRKKKAYDGFSYLLMVVTVGCLLFSQVYYSVIALLLTTLALTSSNNQNVVIKLLEKEAEDEILEKHLKG